MDGTNLNHTTPSERRAQNEQAQETLRISEIRYRRLFESARDGILILDVETRRITDVNPFMVELLGYSRDEFLGKELWEIGLLRDAEASADAFRELQENGYIRYEDLPLQTAWGKRREVEFVSNVYAENGHQVIQCNIRDITVRKQAERAVRESKELCTFVTESMPQKIFTARPDGEVDYCNKPWLEFSGLSLEQMKGVNWTRLLHPDDVEESLQLWQHSVATGQPFQCERRFQRADGVYRWHLSRAHAMRDERGRVRMWICSCTDIDDRKRVEAELQQLMVREHAARDAAETANRTKDEFLAMVSHELRTPLTAILGFSTLLRRGELSETNFTRALTVIESSARAQAQLIEDILDVSRIVAGKLRLEVGAVALAPILNAAIDSLRLAAEAKTIKIRTHLDPDVGLVAGDPNRLQQVVLNLVSNAIKFTPEAGQVEVRLERADSHAQITVSDNGQGINAEFLPHVFDHFRQSDSASTRQYSGLGLGLSIVRNIVQLHGGTAHAASPGKGQGASFTVSIPLMALRTGESSPPSEWQRLHPALQKQAGFDRPPALSGLRVIIVDDEPNTLAMLHAVLEYAGAEVRTCGSAVNALDLLQQWKPDVLISDMAMPDKDGYWLIAQVREREAEQEERIAAVALTAYVRVEERTRVLEAGFDMFVPKPVEAVELLAIVASLVNVES